MISDPRVRSCWRGVVVASVLSGGLMIAQSQDQSSPPGSSPSPPPMEVVRRVHVPGDEAVRMLVKRVPPAYSKELRKKHIQGAVVMTVFVSKDGDVEEVKPISGHPALVQIATDAVKQWKYRPYMAEGAAVEMVTDVKMNFTLAND